MEKEKKRLVFLCLVLIALVLGGVLFSWRILHHSKQSTDFSIFYPSVVDSKQDTKTGALSRNDIKVSKESVLDEVMDIDDLIDDMGRQQQIDMRLHLDEVLPYDKKIAARFDIPDNELPATQTDKLAEHFVNSPCRIWFGMYNDRNIGITRAIRASKTLQELYNRSDMINGIMKIYSDTPIEIEKMKDRKPGRISMSLMHCDQFVMYPTVFPKTKGYERVLLLLLYDRYERMTKVNNEMGEDAPYSAVFNTTKELALRLLERLDAHEYEILKDENDTQVLTRIGQLLKTE